MPKTNEILYFFTDTNLFIECLALKELPWDQWKEFKEIHVIVTPPVIKEIDNRKKQGNDRVGKKSRKTNSLFKEIITGADGFKTVQTSPPTVKLFVKSEYRYTEELADKINLEERDEQLIATIYDFKKSNPELDVRLLSHDGYPLSLARTYDIPFFSIPDDWLLPPENSKAEKKIQALETEVARFKKQEPEFEIQCINEEDAPLDKLECEYTRYQALTDEEITKLIEVIKEKTPKIESFDDANKKGESGQLSSTVKIMGMTHKYTPPTEKDISNYHENYEAWLIKCKDFLKSYHQRVQYNEGKAEVCFAVENKGIRPAKDALVTLTASGSFEIMPPENKDEKETKAEDFEHFPAAPKPPEGKREVVGFGHASRSLDALVRGLSPFDYGHSVFSNRDLIMPHIPNIDRGRNPNGFYYKPNRPLRPCSSFELECEQWRHANGHEYFPCEIHFTPNENQEEIRGALECRIHAENLSACEIKRLPLQVKIKSEGLYQRAIALIDRSLVGFSLRLKRSNEE